MSIEVDAALLNARQAAALLGISMASLYRYANEAKLPAPVRVGRSVRWREDELRQWIAAGCPERAEWEARKGE